MSEKLEVRDYHAFRDRDPQNGRRCQENVFSFSASRLFDGQFGGLIRAEA